jgi:hypothetical protein
MRHEITWLAFMGDTVPSQGRGGLKRTRSAVFSPAADAYTPIGDGDFVGSYSSYGAAVFANEVANDTIPSALLRFDDDKVDSSNGVGGGFSIGLRQPIDDIGWQTDDMPIFRTRTQESIRSQIEDDGLAPYIPGFTPRERPDPSGRTPRCRQDLTTEVDLELVGTTLVAKTANDQVKIDVRLHCYCVSFVR